jgi:antitoxin VapB
MLNPKGPETSLCQTPPAQRRARLFRNGRNQALRIPREFELPGDEVMIHKDGHRLIVEPLKKANTLAELLASWEPLDEEFPDVDDGLLPLDDVKL